MGVKSRQGRICMELHNSILDIQKKMFKDHNIKLTYAQASQIYYGHTNNRIIEVKHGKRKIIIK